MKFPAFVAALLLLAAPAASAAPTALVLAGEDGREQAVTAAEIKALPHVDARVTHEGKVMAFRGVLLSDLLKTVAAPLGKEMRGPALADVVIVTAADGYVATLALSDLEPSIRATRVVLADGGADGAALDKDGPYRLVVDGDLKPARAERNVVRIEVRRLRAPH